MKRGPRKVTRLVNFKLTAEDEARLLAIRNATYSPTNTAAVRLALIHACRTLGVRPS